MYPGHNSFFFFVSLSFIINFLFITPHTYFFPCTYTFILTFAVFLSLTFSFICFLVFLHLLFLAFFELPNIFFYFSHYSYFFCIPLLSEYLFLCFFFIISVLSTIVLNLTVYFMFPIFIALLILHSSFRFSFVISFSFSVSSFVSILIPVFFQKIQFLTKLIKSDIVDFYFCVSKWKYWRLLQIILKKYKLRKIGLTLTFIWMRMISVGYN